MVFSSLSAFADRKHELENRAKEAAAAGKADEAARLYCEQAALDPDNQSLKQTCAEMEKEAARERQKNDQRFADGLVAYKSGNFDDAEQKFKNIRSGPHVDEARRYVQETIPAARLQREAERSMEQKFQQGTQAYDKNDFASAKTLLNQITGTHASDAQEALAKIRQFEQTMSQGNALAVAKDYKGAAASYNQAASIKADGPGDPLNKAARVQALVASVQSASAPSKSPERGQSGSPVSQPVPAASPLVAAVKPARPAADVATLMREAQQARQRNAISLAQGKYLAVLTVDPQNARARAALKELKGSGSAVPQKASSDADIMLARAIQEFYTGQYEDAEVHIRDYLSNNGAKTALSYFYLGVCKMTRFYLDGEPEGERKLYIDALEAFRNAKISGFSAPDERYISPKILKAFRES
jgi:outer membrane protein assembly factor BamD (BamD/ComL family)